MYLKCVSYVIVRYAHTDAAKCSLPFNGHYLGEKAGFCLSNRPADIFSRPVNNVYLA